MEAQEAERVFTSIVLRFTRLCVSWERLFIEERIRVSDYYIYSLNSE